MKIRFSKLGRVNPTRQIYTLSVIGDDDYSKSRFISTILGKPVKSMDCRHPIQAAFLRLHLNIKGVKDVVYMKVQCCNNDIEVEENYMRSSIVKANVDYLLGSNHIVFLYDRNLSLDDDKLIEEYYQNGTAHKLKVPLSVWNTGDQPTTDSVTDSKYALVRRGKVNVDELSDCGHILQDVLRRITKNTDICIRSVVILSSMICSH